MTIFERLTVDKSQAHRSADVLRVAGHPLRLQILASLCEQPLSVSELAVSLTSQQSLVSQHLRILRMSGLVRAHRQGCRSLYQLLDERLRDVIRSIGECTLGTK